MCQLVSALVQFPVANLSFFEDYGYSVGIASHLLFEQFVHTNIRKRHVSVIRIV